MDDRQLRTAWQNRQQHDATTQLGGPLTMLMQHTLRKRVRQLGELARAWDQIVPEEFQEHTALESFCRGTLTVLVDSAPHRYQLETLLREGLLRSLTQRFSGALNRVRLVPGQFYSVDVEGYPRYSF
jgi:hypothetical protein